MDKIKLDLYGPIETTALIIAIEKQVMILSNSDSSRDIMHLFALQQILKRICPQLEVLAAQEREDDNALTTTIAELQNLLTWPDGWNSYDASAPNPEAVSHATTWITEVHEMLIATKQQWIAPKVTANAVGNVILSWRRGQRDLEVYVEKQDDMFYIIIDGEGIDAKFTDGDIKTINDIQQLWQWLLDTAA